MPGFEGPADLTPQDRRMMEENLWYIKAREKIASFLPQIDPGLEVDIRDSVITPSRGGDRYETPTLIFTHRSKPDMKWTMEIKKDDDYINHKLEGVVRRIYKERLRER